MLDRILVPIDGSLVSEVAVKFAVQILPEGASLTLLTVVPILPQWTSGLPDVSMLAGEYEDNTGKMLAEANAYVRRVAQDLCLAPNHVRTAVQIGDPAQCIIDMALKLQADMLIMTTHGRSGLSRWVFGSVTNKVLGAAPCPILIVPKSHIEQHLERQQSELALG